MDNMAGRRAEGLANPLHVVASDECLPSASKRFVCQANTYLCLIMSYNGLNVNLYPT
jgi:hypothetical protein